jgi:transposase-like protein
MKGLIFFYNVLSRLYRFGIWILFFQGIKGICSFPLILGGCQKVEISKEGNKYTIKVNVPISYCFNSDSALDRDIVICILNEARGIDGQKIIVQQALAESFGLKDRREIDNRMQRYRQSGQSMKGIVGPHILRARVLTEEVKEAIHSFWIKNWWATEQQVFEHLQHIGLFKADAKFCSPTIRAAVSKDFLKLRAQVKKAFVRELISYKKDELVKQLFDLVQSQYDLLKVHNLVPQVDEIKTEALKNFSRVNTLKKDLKEIARIKNMKTLIMNPQIQDTHPAKPLEAIKLYAYFNSSYGYIAHHLKVSKSTVFYWVQSFILSLQMSCPLPATCSGTIGFDAKWVKITKSFSPLEKSKGAKWRYVYVAVDCHTYDLLHIQIFSKEDKNCTKLFLLQLKNKGFYPSVIITDMHPAYPEPIKQVFPKALHAICIFHLLQAIQRHIKEVFGKEYEKNKKIMALKKEIYHLFDAKDKRTVIKRMQSIMAKREDFLSLNPKADKIFNCIQSHFSQALLCIGNPKIPHTNNASERLIRRFNQHYKNMAGFESIATARAYLTLFAFFYRTTPLYEAKNKGIRGLAPLQIAGVNISTIPEVKAFAIA